MCKIFYCVWGILIAVCLLRLTVTLRRVDTLRRTPTTLVVFMLTVAVIAVLRAVLNLVYAILILDTPQQWLWSEGFNCFFFTADGALEATMCGCLLLVLLPANIRHSKKFVAEVSKRRFEAKLISAASTARGTPIERSPSMSENSGPPGHVEAPAASNKAAAGTWAAIRSIVVLRRSGNEDESRNSTTAGAGRRSSLDRSLETVDLSRRTRIEKMLVEASLSLTGQRTSLKSSRRSSSSSDLSACASQSERIAAFKLALKNSRGAQNSNDDGIIDGSAAELAAGQARAAAGWARRASHRPSDISESSANSDDVVLDLGVSPAQVPTPTRFRYASGFELTPSYLTSV